MEQEVAVGRAGRPALMQRLRSLAASPAYYGARAAASDVPSPDLSEYVFRASARRGAGEGAEPHGRMQHALGEEGAERCGDSPVATPQRMYVGRQREHLRVAIALCVDYDA